MEDSGCVSCPSGRRILYISVLFWIERSFFLRPLMRKRQPHVTDITQCLFKFVLENEFNKYLIGLDGYGLQASTSLQITHRWSQGVECFQIGQSTADISYGVFVNVGNLVSLLRLALSIHILTTIHTFRSLSTIRPFTHSNPATYKFVA